MIFDKTEEHDRIATRMLSNVRDYSQVYGLTFDSTKGLSFDPCMQAPVKSYEEMQERERADRERRELEEREGRRLTETAINIALMGACLGGS